MGINESKQTEAQGLGTLKKNGTENAEAIIAQFAKGDISANQRNIPLMAFAYGVWNYQDINNIILWVNDYENLVRANKIKPMLISGKVAKIGEVQFNNFLDFAEFIDGEKQKYSSRSREDDEQTVAKFKAEKTPMWSGNNIDIYEGDDVGKCIAYTMGGLTGKGYSFCIGQPANTMYQSYRDTKSSSFYYIIDKNHFKNGSDGSVDLSDPLHIVVFDNTTHGIELTDASNKTGEINEPYGKDTEEYVKYLKSNGVPVDKLVNRPKTDQEKKEQELLGRQNKDLNWFKKLPFEYKSKYIGRGHLLTDDQFDYLMGTK